MNISIVKKHLRKGRSGTFRMLREGETIEAADVIVHDCFYDYPSEKNIGQACEKQDCIMRLAFDPEQK